MDDGFKVDIDSLSQMLERRGLEPKGRVQKYIDSEVLRLSSPYLPFQSGELERSGIMGTDIGSGDVMYNTPKARYLYYGKVMIGRAPKQLTDKDLTYHGTPMRGAYFFERMKTDRLKEILKGAAQIAGGE